MDLDTLQNLREAVFKKQTVLAGIYENHGQKSLTEYVSGWRMGSLHNYEGLLNGVRSACERIYGPVTASEVVTQMREDPIVSTIDHHGILNHPIFVNANLIYSLRPQTYLICFSTAGVSLNNVTSWSGCLLLRGGSQVCRLSFFRDKQKTQAVLATEAFSRADVDRVAKNVRNLEFLTRKQKEKLQGLIEGLTGTSVLDAKDFSTQASLMTAELWRAVFPAAPKVVYIPLEEVIAGIIVNTIAKNPDHVLHALFFSASGWDLIEKHFLGSLGAFTGSHKGSFLFWGINKKRRRVHLVRNGNKLVDHEFEVEAGPAPITKALGEGVLYPTSLACFLTLLYYGLTCVGGFNQVNWLTNIKHKFVQLLAEVGHVPDSRRIAGAITDNFAEGTLAFLPDGNAATGIDLFLGSDYNWYEQYHKLAGLLKVGESIDAQLPEIYKVITPSPERDPRLLSLTEFSILEGLEIKSKLAELYRI